MSEIGEQDSRALTASRLKSSRELLGLTQSDVAEAVGIPRPSVAAIEAAKRGVSAVELRQFARLYRRPVTWLLGDEDSEPEQAQALLRATETLSPEDREQVLRFAQFLGSAGKAPGRRPGAKNSGTFIAPTLDDPAQGRP